MATLAEVLRELENLRHHRAVWMELVEHLSKFVDQEVRHADQAIPAEGCVVSKVPQPIVKEFLDYINHNEITPLNIRIDEIENLGVTETKDDNPENQEKDTPAGKAKGKGNKAAKTPPAPKGIRVIAKPLGHKIQGTS